MTRTVVLSLFNIEDMSFWYDENLDFFIYKILNHKTLFSTKPFNNDNFIVVLYFGKNRYLQAFVNEMVLQKIENN